MDEKNKHGRIFKKITELSAIGFCIKASNGM